MFDFFQFNPLILFFCFFSRFHTIIFFALRCDFVDRILLLFYSTRSKTHAGFQPLMRCASMLESPWPANLMYVGGQELPISSKAGDFFLPSWMGHEMWRRRAYGSMLSTPVLSISSNLHWQSVSPLHLLTKESIPPNTWLLIETSKGHVHISWGTHADGSKHGSLH